ncbi:unnamed protein product [Clonostachys solani]|uniref:Amidase domain-containing protein n=1 Tax=Clonostachys solani TaxID=160281 RepID=A0A9N9YX31_9HYPO|nr:unnamed protein product [Clonostachys solani]
MRRDTIVVAAALLMQPAFAGFIQPALQALTWKFNGTDFWAPVHLDSAVYHLQSRAGVITNSLSKRGSSSGGYLGCTVLTISDPIESLSSAILDSLLSEYEIDDVWSAEQFLDCLFIQYNGTKNGVALSSSVADSLGRHGVEHLFLHSAFNATGLATTVGVSIVESNCELGNGPYVVTLPDCEEGGLSMTPVYALHPDNYEAFMYGSYVDATEAGRHQQLHVSLPGTRVPDIIVPSRLSSTTPVAGPLAGLRFGVKDIFHIKGLKTSGGSRAYYEAYGYQNYTTETVQLCENAGASLIGKLRTITFALGTPRNGMSVDFHDPWNARGDGYMSTGGSSSGSGAAVTAYDWVDFALGSDTGGSVRFPARFGGVYGYKPTHGIYNLTGILVAIAEQDTPGFLARSPGIFTRVGRVWADGKPLAPSPEVLPRKMLRYDEQAAFTQPAAAEMIKNFFVHMARVLDLSDNQSVNITKRFLDSNVSETASPQTPAVWMNNVYSDLNNVQGWDEIGAPLATAYGEIPGREGAFPPIEPPVNMSWTDGRDPTTRARYPESQRRRQVFGDWFNREILPGNNETCSEYLFAHSYHIPPNTVKTDPAEARYVTGWYDGLYVNYAKMPEIVVPIGQIEYRSKYTNRTEWQTVTVALGVAKGCDLVLFDVVDKLAEAGLLKEVMAGVLAYPLT